MNDTKILDLLKSVIKEKTYLSLRDLPFVIALFKYLKVNNIDFDTSKLDTEFDDSLCHDICLVKESVDLWEKAVPENLYSKEKLEDLLN